MSSLKRVLSSRANGARSRGPTSAAGKKASSLNAVRHGLLANCVVLSNECRENFNILLDQHIERYSPIDDVELGVIEEMVAAFWRLRRAWAIETRLHEDAMAANQSHDEVGRITGAFTDLASSPQLGLLHRYEARLHHIRQRAFENIQILRNTQLPVAVGIAVARYPPHRSVRAAFPHTAPTSDEWRQSEHSDTDA